MTRPEWNDKKAFDNLAKDLSEFTLKPEEFFGSFSEIPTQAEPAKLCGEWLRAGSLSMVYSRAGIGKTAWLGELVLSLSTGQQFMGMHCNKVTRILWINGDMPLWQVHERLGYLNGHATLWHVMFDDLMLRQQEVADRCRDFDLVVFDNRPALFDLGDANVAEAWKPLMNLLRQICNQGAAVLVATHEGKGEGVSSFGSSAQEWQLDNNVRISPRTLTAKEEEEYLDKCMHIPTRKVEWFKHRLSDQPPSREFYFRRIISGQDVIAPMLVCEWGCFYKMDGSPIVRKAGK